MHSRLEQYVEQVETRLAELPPAQRESETEEMRQHIAAMVEARMESGLCEDKAITETLEQFGQAQTVSRELAQAHGRNHKLLPDNLLTATICAVLCICGSALLLFLSLIRIERDGLHLRLLDGCSQYVQWAYEDSIMLAGCLVAGAMTGALFPRRALMGILLPYLVWCSMGISNISRLHNVAMRDYLWGCGFWIVTATFTMAGAKMGARWRKRRYYRRRLVA